MTAINYRSERYPEAPTGFRLSGCGRTRAPRIKTRWRLEGWAALLSICIAFFAVMPKPAAAQELEGDYLYRFETIRAAPGKLEAL
ncbi:MAG: hypothetical protein ACX939_10430, partial [Hyphococcus sp.]